MNLAYPITRVSLISIHENILQLQGNSAFLNFTKKEFVMIEFTVQNNNGKLLIRQR